MQGLLPLGSPPQAAPRTSSSQERTQQTPSMPRTPRTGTSLLEGELFTQEGFVLTHYRIV